MQIGHFLVKIAQGGYGAGTGLDFIEEKEGFPRCDLLSEQHLQVGADTRRPEITIEQPAQGRITLQIHQSKGFKLVFTKFLERPGFTNLPGPS